ncbi:MAG: hypothetical protein U0640_10140 [Phycisphaerales bacterium]
MHPSPLLSTYQAANAPLLTWGGGAAGIEGGQGIKVPAALNPIEIEYAAIRKHCALLDLSIRGTLELRGPESIDFLNRMVTQELKPKDAGFEVGSVRRSLWLNRKGRIDADLRVIRLKDRLILELDALAAERTTKSLSSFIITEDCELKDTTQATHRLALHGPTAWELLRIACAGVTESPIAPAICIETSIASASCILYREDSAGVPGFELIVPATQASAVIGKLVECGHDSAHANFESPHRAIALRQANNPAAHIRMLPIGWHAYNIARVEAKTPLFNVDFGMENLPAEMGEATLKDRVSFTKGCYLGQEVVARMYARKQSKQSLMFVRFDAAATEGYPPIPSTGAALATCEPGSELAIGAITSAVPSPQRSMACVALAQVKSSSPPGTKVRVEAEGTWLTGVLESL